MAFDVRSAAEDEFPRGANVAFDRSIYLCDRDVDDGFRHLRARADDQGSVR